MYILTVFCILNTTVKYKIHYRNTMCVCVCVYMGVRYITWVCVCVMHLRDAIRPNAYYQYRLSIQTCCHCLHNVFVTVD